MFVPQWFGTCKGSSGAFDVNDSSELSAIYLQINCKSRHIFEKYNISIEEEQILREFYHSKIRDICGALDYSLLVEYDAHYFLHKYFVKYGLLEFDVKHAMLACIYLATKTQNLHLTMDEFVSKIPNTVPDLIVRLEVVILQSCEFCPSQSSPLPCLFGFILSLFSTDSEIHNFFHEALDLLQIAFLIDELILIESPSLIALACVLDLNSERHRKFISHTFESPDSLLIHLSKIRAKIEEYQDPPQEILRAIDLKIKLIQK